MPSTTRSTMVRLTFSERLSFSKAADPAMFPVFHTDYGYSIIARWSESHPVGIVGGCSIPAPRTQVVGLAQLWLDGHWLHIGSLCRCGSETPGCLVRPTGYVVIEVKTGKFQPEYAGKLNFYVATPFGAATTTKPSASSSGTKNDRSVRYSLGRSTSPMAVAAYTYDKLPASEQQALPKRGAPCSGLGMDRTRL